MITVVVMQREVKVAMNFYSKVFLLHPHTCTSPQLLALAYVEKHHAKIPKTANTLKQLCQKCGRQQARVYMSNIILSHYLHLVV